MSSLDWKNERQAKLKALRILNALLIKALPIEECAASEARAVEFKLTNEAVLSDAEVTDFLHQAAIDVETQILNKKQYVDGVEL